MVSSVRRQPGSPDDGGSPKPKVARCSTCKHRVSFHANDESCLVPGCECNRYVGPRRKWEVNSTVEEVAELLDVTPQWVMSNSGALGGTWVKWKDLYTPGYDKDQGSVIVFPMIKLKRILDAIHAVTTEPRR